jgi:hypothetical protein
MAQPHGGMDAVDRSLACLARWGKVAIIEFCRDYAWRGYKWGDGWNRGFFEEAVGRHFKKVEFLGKSIKHRSIYLAS